MFGVTRGRYKPIKHILLPTAVKSFTGNAELVETLTRLGHSISYSQLEKVDTSLWLQKLAMTPQGEVSLPGNIHPYINTILAFDKIDRLEGTLSGGGTSHRVNGIVIQPLTYGPHMPKDLTKVEKRKERAITLEEDDPPIYNVGQRVGPPKRKVQEVDGESIINEARKKNLLFVLARLRYAANKQKVGNWTGFNILVQNCTIVSLHYLFIA